MLWLITRPRRDAIGVPAKLSVIGAQRQPTESAKLRLGHPEHLLVRSAPTVVPKRLERNHLGDPMSRAELAALLGDDHEVAVDVSKRPMALAG